MKDERELVVPSSSGALWDRMFREVFARELARIEAERQRLAEEACDREGHGWDTLLEGRWCIHCHITDPPGPREGKRRLNEAEIRADERRRICREEGCKPIENTGLGELERSFRCARCGESRTEPRGEPA